MAAIQVRKEHYSAIFILAFANIAFQVLLTRIFSLTLFYHFAFAGISFAMLGLAAGALRVYTQSQRFSAENVNKECAYNAILFSVFALLGVFLHADLPGRLGMSINLSNTFAYPTLSILASFLVIMMAFFYNGVCIALLLTRLPDYTNRLYMADLLGAATGCILVVTGLYFYDPITALLIVLSFVSVIVFRLVNSSENDQYRKLTTIGMYGFVALALVQMATYHTGRPLLKVRWDKNNTLTRMVYESWNAYSHVSVRPYWGKGVPFGWGFGKPVKAAYTEQLWLMIDADSGTVLTRYNGNPETVSFLKEDFINLGYHIRKPKQVAVIGVGGGRDILSALTFGAEHVTGIELNPTIYKLLTNRYAKFTGNLAALPQVTLVNAEARSYLNSVDQQYDLIQISAIDTWSAIMSGGLTLAENKLYTKDAWVEFLHRLNDRGILSLNRGFVSGKNHGSFYRLISLAADAVREINPQADVRRHMLLARVKREVKIIVSKSPFSPEEVQNFHALCRKYGFIPVLTPDIAFDKISATIANGQATEEFYDSLPFDWTAPTDDRPFFFNTVRFADVFTNKFKDHPLWKNLNKNNLATKIVFYILLMTLLATLWLVVKPLLGLYLKHPRAFTLARPSLFYFISIGLGFMFIEMSQMQRLIIFLGHPVYGLTVILFTMLFFSGIGSYTVKNGQNRSQMVWRATWLCTMLIVVGLATPEITMLTKQYDTSIRIVTSVALLIPISFFMGMMFPMGVEINKDKQADLLPWFWGVNGIASVLASILSMVFSMSYGIGTTYWIGVCCYICSLLLLLRITVPDFYIQGASQSVGESQLTPLCA